MYPVPIWHMDREIKIRKYDSARILSGFYKAVVNLQIVEVEVICFLALWLPIWNPDLEIKMQKYVSTRILSGVYKTDVSLQICKVEVIGCPHVPCSYLAYRSSN